jgi:outer membrane protein TolC
VLAEVEQAYWSLYGTQKNLEIALQQVDLAEEQVQISRRLEKAGVVSNVDVLRSLSGLQLRQQFAVSARLQVKLANRQLKQVMQAPDLQVDTPAEVIAASAPNLVGLDFDRDALTAKAIDNRLELVDLALQYQQNQLAANVAENQILPKIDFVFQGRLLGLGTTAGSSSNQAWHGDSSEFFAGLSFSQGLAMNQTARANYRQACLTLARTTAQQQQVRINIVRQVNDAVDRFEQNWDRILVAQEAVTAARATFDAETRLFELGQRTSDLVLIAASNLATAQQQLVQAVVDYQISRVEIALATGTILGYAQMPPLQAVPVPPEPVGPQPAFGPARPFVP